MTLWFVTGHLLKETILGEKLVCVCVCDGDEESMSLFWTYCVYAGWTLNEVTVEKRNKGLRMESWAVSPLKGQL